jgi:DNA mismatch repair protein MSH4
MGEIFDIYNSTLGTNIISVVENRSREICISKMCSKNLGSLEVFLVGDNNSYMESLSLIEELSPHEILLHDGMRGSVLSGKISRYFPESSVIFISRQYFDQDRGADLLNHILVGKADADLISKYTVLAGTNCLLRYIENCSGHVFPANSVRLEYRMSSSGKMMIDRRTAVNLELIGNCRTGSQKESLFGIVNRTKTNSNIIFLLSSQWMKSTSIF